MSGLFTPEIKTDIEAQERVIKWLEALRSGKYLQADGHLRVDNAYCCLGVACDLSGGRWFNKDEDGVWTFTHDLDVVGGGVENDLPRSVRNDLHLATYTGGFIDDDRQLDNALSLLNDSGEPFDKIADIIEHEYTVALA